MMTPITFVGGPYDGVRIRDLNVEEPKATYDVADPGDDSNRLYYDLSEGETRPGAAYVYRIRTES